MQKRSNMSLEPTSEVIAAADFLIQLVKVSEQEKGIKRDDAVTKLAERGFYRGWDDLEGRKAVRWATIMHSAAAKYRGKDRLVICGDHILLASAVAKTQASRKKKGATTATEHPELELTLAPVNGEVTIDDGAGPIHFNNVSAIVVRRKAPPMK